MKKIIAACLAAAVLPAGAASARLSGGEEHSVGDVIGTVYYSDITAELDGAPIRSYNIGGRTVIELEDLTNYGFRAEWNEGTRTLSVAAGERTAYAAELGSPGGASGDIAGSVYYSDIDVFIGGAYYIMETYNIGGITCAAVEDMACGEIGASGEALYSAYGMHYKWDAQNRKISLYTLREGDTLHTQYGSGTVEKLTARYSYRSFMADNGTEKEGYSIQNILTESGEWERFIRPGDIPKQWGITISAENGAPKVESAADTDMNREALGGETYGTYGHPSLWGRLAVLVRLSGGEEIAVMLPNNQEDCVLFSTSYIAKKTGREWK